MRTTLFMVGGLLGVFFSSPTWAYSSPLCPPSGQANVDQACEYGVRAKEYALRHWYVEALYKYEAAHLFDYGNATYINQIISTANTIVAGMNGVPFSQADRLYPELQMAGASDQVARSLYLSSWATAAGTGSQFQSFLSSINISDWTARSSAGIQAATSLNLSSLQKFSNLLKFTRIDLQYTVRNFLSDTHSLIPCSVFYPFQFVYSNQAMMTLVSALPQFVSTGCANDVYRAILVQAFLSGGSPVVLVDSNFKPIVYASSDSSVESLSNPQPVLASRILDSKLGNAIIDSVVFAQRADQNSNISVADLDGVVSGLTGFLSAMSVSTDDQITFYKGMIAHAITQSDIMYLQLAARLSDQLNLIESGRRK